MVTSPLVRICFMLAALERRQNKIKNSFEDWAGIGLDEYPSYNLTACDVDDPSSLEGKQIHQTSMIRPWGRRVRVECAYGIILRIHTSHLEYGYIAIRLSLRGEEGGWSMLHHLLLARALSQNPPDWQHGCSQPSLNLATTLTWQCPILTDALTLSRTLLWHVFYRGPNWEIAVFSSLS